MKELSPDTLSEILQKYLLEEKRYDAVILFEDRQAIFEFLDAFRTYIVPEFGYAIDRISGDFYEESDVEQVIIFFHNEDTLTLKHAVERSFGRYIIDEEMYRQYDEVLIDRRLKISIKQNDSEKCDPIDAFLNEYTIIKC